LKTYKLADAILKVSTCIDLNTLCDKSVLQRIRNRQKISGLSPKKRKKTKSKDAGEARQSGDVLKYTTQSSGPSRDNVNVDRLNHREHKYR